MGFVKLARQASSRADEVWEARTDAEKNQVVIQYGKRGSSLRMKVVPQTCFTEFNAELELEYRASKKRESGYVDEIESEVSPKPATRVQETPWPTLYAEPTKGLSEREALSVQRERDVAQEVMVAFDLEIPPEWLDRPRVIESGNGYALPMLLYALGVCRHGVICLADDEGNEIQPIRFVESHVLTDLDSRVGSLLPRIGLVSARQAMASCDQDIAETEENDWFF